MFDFTEPYNPTILDPQATRLDLSSITGITDTILTDIVSFLRSNPPALKSLAFGYQNNLGGRVHLIIEALKTNTNIKSLSLFQCHLGLAEFDMIGQLLKENQTIRVINLGANLDREQTMRNIRPSRADSDSDSDSEVEYKSKRHAKKARRKTSIAKAQKLAPRKHAHKSRPLAAPLDDFFSGIQTNRTLTSLCLTQADLDYGSFIDKLSKAIAANRGLVTLDLSCTKLLEDKLATLLKACDSNPTITTLDLHCNQFGSVGIRAIADWLKKPTCKVTTLDLNNNKQIESHDTAYLFEAMTHNSSVTSLSFAGMKEYADSAAIASMLRSNMTLTKLNMFANKIGDEGAVMIAAALMKNRVLSELILGANDIKNEGCARLLECPLDSIDFGGNRITEVTTAIHPKIQSLDFEGGSMSVFQIPNESGLERCCLSSTSVTEIVIPDDSKLLELNLYDTNLKSLTVPFGSPLKVLKLSYCKLDAFECVGPCQLQTLEIWEPNNYPY